MRLSILIILMVVQAGVLNAQQATITGTITDTINKQNLANTSVVLLRQKDSVMVTYTRSDKEGKFLLKNVPAGKFLLMITYPSYADFIDTVSIGASEEKTAGLIRMTLKSRLLEEVLVRAKIAAVRMKGDTVEYRADSFKVREGASVEEMLRKMPGLQVDKDGNVTAQGERIQKVLVDGEEFFGDDPTMATKNLQANAIDKVQVFDKKSDQAAFTGIDDGTKTKTLNLTLKDDMKKGYFGKVELSGGLANRWNNTVMVNSFKSKRKFSVYGIMSSIGKTGLDWDERGKYGSGPNVEYDADGGYFSWNGDNDEFEQGNFYGKGVPTAWNGGFQYSQKFDGDKQNVNGSYRYGKINNSGTGNTVSQSILPNNIFTNRETDEFFSSKQRHSANGTYEYQIDSFTSLKVVASGFAGTQNSTSLHTSSSLDSVGNLINTSNRLSTAFGDNSSLKSNILLRRRFKKDGRTVSLSFDQQLNTTNNEGLLQAVNKFYEKPNILINIDSVDQQKLNEISNSGYYTRLAYTEPVVKNVFVELSYGRRVSNSESKRLSYDKSSNGKYEVLNNIFSNHYDFNVLTNSTGMTWRLNTKKVTLSGGGDVAFASFKQSDLINDTVLRYKFTNFFPRSSFQYKFNANSRIGLRYDGVTRQPSIDQIQPIRDNTNPLNIAIGNPGLKQEFRHSFNLNFNSYKVLQQRGFYTYASFTTTANAIATNEITALSGDTIGKRTFQYINLNGNYNGNSGGGYNWKIKKIDLGVQVGFNLNVSRYNSFVNRLRNVTDNNSYGITFSTYKFKEKKFDVNYYGDVTWNTSTSSIQADRKTNYLTQSHNIYFNYSLPKKFELNTRIEANLRQKINAFDENNVVLWSGYIGKKFLKNDKGMIRLQANDILDQNRGFNRFVSSSVVREETFNQLRRYFLLTFVWNFSKNPGAPSGQ